MCDYSVVVWLVWKIHSRAICSLVTPILFFLPLFVFCFFTVFVHKEAGFHDCIYLPTLHVIHSSFSVGVSTPVYIVFLVISNFWQLVWMPFLLSCNKGHKEISCEPLVEGLMWIMNLHVYKFSLVCTDFVKDTVSI